MSTVVTKHEAKTLVVGFDSGGCIHAELSAAGIQCHLLEGNGQNPWVTCHQNPDTCECVWDEENGIWTWQTFILDRL